MATGRAPAGLVRTVGPPLLVYHLLIFLGAYFVVAGVLEGSFGSELVGGALVGAGIAVEVAVLVWSAGLTRRAAAEAVAERPRDPGMGGRRCYRCDWRGDAPGAVCPRCGAYPLAGPIPPRNDRGP